MNKHWLRLIGCAGAVGNVFVLPQSAAADGGAPSLVRAVAPGWPQWQGARRDGVSDEKGLRQSWPEGGPKLLWKVTGIGRGYSAPVISQGSVYVTGDQGAELSISSFTTNGQPRWKAANGAPWTKSFPGSRSSCCFDGGKVYHLNAHGDLVCLDATTGERVWGFNLLERYEAKNIMWGISESVLVCGDHVFATPSGAKGLMVALDKRNGTQVWATPSEGGGQASYSSPILIQEGSRKMLVNCNSTHAFGVDAETGALVWQLPHVDPKNTVNITPMLAGRHLLLNNTSRDYGVVFGVKVDGGPAVRAWMRELKISHNGAVCVEGKLYGASSKGDLRGWVALDVATGASTALNPAGDLAEGSMIFADGRFYCLAATGVMMLLEVTDSGFRSVGSFRLAEGKVQDAWAHPVVCHGRLYLRFHDTLFCYDVRR